MRKWVIGAGVALLAILAWDVVFPPRQPAPDAGTFNGNPVVVTRGAFGSCPDGYVDHPMNPDWCALPAAAERMLERARR